jgi:hypothetical protein
MPKILTNTVRAITFLIIAFSFLPVANAQWYDVPNTTRRYSAAELQQDQCESTENSLYLCNMFLGTNAKKIDCAEPTRNFVWRLHDQLKRGGLGGTCFYQEKIDVFSDSFSVPGPNGRQYPRYVFNHSRTLRLHQCVSTLSRACGIDFTPPQAPR